MLRSYRCTISSQAPASPAIQRRTSSATTWASSNQHSPELLVSARSVRLRRHSKPQHHNIDTLLWSKSSGLPIKQGILAGPRLKANNWRIKMPWLWFWAAWTWIHKGSTPTFGTFRTTSECWSASIVYSGAKAALHASSQRMEWSMPHQLALTSEELRKRMHGGHLFALGRGVRW